MGYLFVLVLVVAICYLVNAVKGRPVLNPGRVALIVLAIVLVIDLGMAIAALDKVADRLTPEGQGEFIGQVFGRAFVAMVIAGIIDYSHRRKLRPAT
jgi:hypothetical protein